MKNKPVLLIGAVVVVAAVIIGVVVLGSNKNDSSSNASMHDMNMNNSSSSDNSDAVATDKVTIQNFAFSPASITVKVGTKVTWTNKDSAAHTVTGDSNDGPASGTLAQDASYSFTFTKAGTFKYDCSIHPDMKGTVIVTN